MQLLYQTHSPYARKVLVFVHEVGLTAQVAVIHHETSPTRRNETVFAQNPLGKVPVLIRPEGPAIFDSDVICAYLDTLHDRKPLIPLAGEARWRALQLQAVAQGLCDAGIALRWETVRRPIDLRYAPLAEGFVAKLNAAYEWLDVHLDANAPLSVGQIAVATALSWLEFRGLPSFRRHAHLSTWMDAFQQRSSMRSTPLAGETVDDGPEHVRSPGLA